VDRRKAGSKHHLLVDGGGTPLAARLTGANRHDSTQLIALVDAVPPVRGKVGRPLRRPEALLADRGYDYDATCRRPLRERGITPLIARRGTPHGSGLGACRWVVEQTLALFHQFRRLRTRFDKRDDVHEAFMDLGMCVICWRRLVNHGYF
jgi:transposase